LFDGLHGLTEEIKVKFLELGTGKCLGEVISVLEGLDLKTGRLLRGKGTFRLFYLALELAQRTKVSRHICASFLLVLLDKVFNDAVVKVLATEMGITSSSQDLKDTLVNREKRNVECAASKIIDDDSGFGLARFVKAVGDSSSGRFVNDTKDLQTGDGSSVFGCLALSVIEVCGGVSRWIL